MVMCAVVCCLLSWRYNPFRLYFHSPVAGFSLLVFEASWSLTTTRHSRWDSSRRVINPSQSPLPDNTQQSQPTNIHAPGGIRTHNLSRWAAEDATPYTARPLGPAVWAVSWVKYFVHNCTLCLERRMFFTFRHRNFLLNFSTPCI